jgi:hypothetical protein
MPEQGGAEEVPDRARMGSREQGFLGDRLRLRVGVGESEPQKCPTMRRWRDPSLVGLARRDRDDHVGDVVRRCPLDSAAAVDEDIRVESDIPSRRPEPVMNVFPRSLLLVVCLSSCAAPLEDSPIDPPSSSAPASSCPTGELAFTQETGCVNDGSVEFCLPTGDEALLARVREIAPTIQAGSSRGRAGCDLASETLYFFPTGEAECVAPHGALLGDAWNKLCRIAALPEVRSIVPTWYE